MTKGEYRVPYDKNGNLCHYPSWDGSEWQDNEVFKASLKLDDKVNRGYSAKYVQWRDVHTGVIYPMFIKDLIDLILNQDVYSGLVHEAYWRVQKRGSNFGIRRATADEIK